jgi:K+-transporting ATPase ATPase A chain
MKVASLSILVLTVIILGFSAWACISPWGVAALSNNGPHGFSEIHYAYTSGAGNNGSAFAGLSTNVPIWNTTLGFDCFLGRFFMIVPILALAGHLGKKKLAAQNLGSFPVSGPTFTCLLIGTVIIIGALTFLPALALGPIIEHFLMTGSKILY